jgi:ubiquinone biosynthesis protein Coq4
MIDVRKLKLAMEARHTHLGDFAILKADAFGVRAAPQAEAKLEPVRGYLPPIRLEALRQMPDGSFGREYARHMDALKLQPFDVSERVEREVIERNVFATRYAVTHDIFHLLLGFDTTWAGEMGVLAFAAAQGYTRTQYVGLALAAVLYPLFSPRMTARIWRNLRRGWRLGKQAKFLLGQRFEEQWERPLVEVRRALGLPEAPGPDAGPAPSAMAPARA